MVRAALALTNEVRLDAARFSEGDADGNVKLDFEEFLALQSDSIRRANTVEEIREWFLMASGGAEFCSVNDFFFFSLSKASARAGATALKDAFKRWDRDKTGYLDSVEFARAATEMGFGSVAHKLFKDLDTDNSGAVSYEELERSLLQSKTPGAKELITSLVWSPPRDGADGTPAKLRSPPAFDTSRWKLEGKDASTLGAELRALLLATGAPVADLSDEAIRQLLIQRGIDFRDNAPTTAEQAATIILDGVRADRWRILVGEDAQRLDAMVRQDPEQAYEDHFAAAWRAGKAPPARPAGAD